jgi:hypothetical protein
MRRFIGVSFHTKHGTWAAHAQLRGVRCLVTGFRSETDAAAARDRMALWLGVARDQLNFPDLKPESASQDVIRRELGRDVTKKAPTSRYLGVWIERGTHIVAGVTANGKRYVLSGFQSQREAARSRDRLALSLLGSSAGLNFPKARLAPASFDELTRERSLAPGPTNFGSSDAGRTNARQHSRTTGPFSTTMETAS